MSQSLCKSEPYMFKQIPCTAKQKKFVFSLGFFNQEKGDSALIGHKSN